MAKVSIIITAYNLGRFVKESVESALSQTHSDREVIVVDNGSTDHTRDQLVQFADRVIYCYQVNQERSAARNLGATTASGEFLVFMDGDDRLLTHHLEAALSLFDSEPSFGLVAGGAEYVDEHLIGLAVERPWLSGRPLELESILVGGVAPLHAIMLRREWFERVGGFDATLPVYGAEDMDLWFRLSLAGCPMAWLPRVVCQYRLHGRNAGRNVKAHYTSLYFTLDKLFTAPTLPGNLRGRRDEFYALYHVSEAGRLYSCGDLEAAKECLRSAVKLDPAWGLDGGRRLAEHVIEWQRSLWAGNREGLIDVVLENLPREFPVAPSLRQDVLLMRDKARFYTAAELRDPVVARRLWASIVRRDRSCLFNRGHWSTLIRSFAWESIPYVEA